MAINSATMTLVTKPILISFFLIFISLGSFCKAGHVLYSPERLNAGESLERANWYLKMQEDCNLVLYEGGKPVWASDTCGKATDCYCAMQSDGNLVVYTPSGTPIWASNTGRGSGHYVLVLQKDRNVVIYGDARWSTHTYLGVADQSQSDAAVFLVEVNNSTSKIVPTTANRKMFMLKVNNTTNEANSSATILSSV